jgi:hypothetical protein
MSGGNVCGHGHPHYFVTQRLCNYSAFNGYHYTRSDYSTVRCAVCGSHWRTKADYVSSLPDAPDGWHNMSNAELQQWLTERMQRQVSESLSERR